MMLIPCGVSTAVENLFYSRLCANYTDQKMQSWNVSGISESYGRMETRFATLMGWNEWSGSRS